MQKIVKVTRKGQTIIPVEIREELGIKEGDKLAVEAVNHKIVFRPIPKLEDTCGIFAGALISLKFKKKLTKCEKNISF
jgi:AbrB family looped-hinge helix DNA binding protein